MFELFVLILFGWLSLASFRLAFRVTWGLAKIAAVILFILALPTLIGCLLYASGILLLLPMILMVVAWSILKICI